MSKHTIIGVIVLMSISLLGVVGLQLYWISDAIKVKQEQFDRSVNAALTKVVEKLETDEAVSVVANQMAALNEPATAPPPAETVLALPPEDEVLPQPPAEPVKKASNIKKPQATPPAEKPATTITVSSVTKKKTSAKQKHAVAIGKAADVVYVTPSPGVTVSYSTAGPTSRDKKQKDNTVAAATITADPYLDLLKSLPDTVRFKYPKFDTVYVVDSLLRQGNLYQIEHALGNLPHPSPTRETRKITDAAAILLRTQHNRPIHVSMDTLRHIAVEMDNLKHLQRLPISIQPSEISSMEVLRNDSIFIFRKDTSQQPYFERKATAARPQHTVRALTARTEAGPLQEKRVLRETAVRNEVKVAKPIKVTSERAPTATVKPVKLPDAKANASSIEKIEIKKDKLNDVVQKMVVEFAVKDEPLQQRLNLHNMKPLLEAELQQQGIQLDFGYWVVSGHTDTVAAENIAAIRHQKMPSYKATLFPNDIFDKPDYLGLYFPDSKTYAIRSLWGMLSLSAFFTLVIIATFGTTIHIIYKQKKLSEMKNDFINNMTHEFKTPIATISLATDSITNPKVYENPDRIRYYTGIIKEENKRMNAQVENVLQIALLEKNEFKMNMQPIDVHVLIIKAMDGIRLQVEQRLGKVSLHLEALHHELQSDEVHLYNVICNLLDNANKYSPSSPDIQLLTTNVNGGILIAVEDKGIGMSKDTQQRVFEKFYRVPTGNLHNVKGFGLGLSYVKAIVQAHHGSIRLKSELGKGSRFEIFLPIS